jgi:hypothetical protein
VTLEPSPQDRRTAAAIAVALQRWNDREPGAVVDTVNGPVTIDGYSPGFRRVYFHFGERGPDVAAWRTTFKGIAR